jgi:hypothetical protein
MEFMDYWDTFLHGLPWLLLTYFLTVALLRKK